jgi:hypothetical protein
MSPLFTRSAAGGRTKSAGSSFTFKAPVGNAAVQVIDGAVAGQVGRALGLAVAGQVVGRRHQPALAARQRPGHQARIFNAAVADDGVEAFGHGVHPAVVQFQRQRNGGVPGQKG